MLLHCRPTCQDLFRFFVSPIEVSESPDPMTSVSAVDNVATGRVLLYVLTNCEAVPDNLVKDPLSNSSFNSPADRRQKKS